MKAKVEIEMFHCERCGHNWLPTLQLVSKGRIGYARPRRCAKCKNPYWDVPVKKLDRASNA